MWKIKGAKIGMLLLKLKPGMYLVPVLGPSVMRMTHIGFVRTFCKI